MIKQPTLRDVAEAADVSIATVSMVLSGKGKISKEVTDKVIETAKQLGYSKLYKRRTTKKKSGKYIAILHYESFEYLWNFMRPSILILEEILIQNGYFPVIFDMNKESKTERILQIVCASNADAVFSIHYGNGELFRKLEDLDIPVVVVNNSNYQDRFSSVCVDDFQGAYEAALHLIKLGHNRILYVEYTRPLLPLIIADRFIGFKKAINEYNIEFRDDQRITVDIEELGSMKSQLEKLFHGESEPPTAIFFHDDYIAALSLSILKEIGISVPQGVSIIAPGDVLDYNQPFLPQITTMRINTELMAQIAGDLMINRLKNRPKDIQVLKVKQQLIERGTCRPIGSP